MKYYKKLIKIIKKEYSNYLRKYIEYNKIVKQRFEWNKILINYFHKDRPLNWKDIKRKIKLFLNNKYNEITRYIIFKMK